MLDILEIVAVAFNIGYVILASRGIAWCWPLGIIGSLLSIWLFVEIKLYAEAALFVYYVIIGFYGWYQWKMKRTGQDHLQIREWDLKFHILLFISGYLITWLLYLLLHQFTDAEMPLLNSFTTVFSFIATWLAAKRYIENWIYWVAVNALTIYLYLSQGVQVYAMLSVLNTLMAVYGMYNWSRDFKKQELH